jgi:hypothetical protein
MVEEQAAWNENFTGFLRFVNCPIIQNGYFCLQGFFTRGRKPIQFLELCGLLGTSDDPRSG